MPAIAGLRGTGQFTADFRPTNYRELYTLLEPNGSAPLNALLSMTASEETDDPKFNHFRDELPGRVIRVNNSGGYDAAATSITVDNDDDVNFVVPNTLLYNVRTGEVMRVTAAPASGNTVLTVSRQVGGGTLTIADNDWLVIAGFADAEGGSKPTAVTFDPTVDFNYTQIFKTGVNITGTMKETYLRTGSKEQEMVTKALKLHMADIERTMFFGRRAIENGSSATPRRYTGGLMSLIPNTVDAASGFASANTITETEFDRLLIENIFAWGGKQKIAFCGPRVISNMMKIAKARWQPTQIGGAYGLSFTRYETFAGDLLVYLHPMFRQVADLNGVAVVLDLPYLKYRYMKGRDTQLKRNVQANDADGFEHFYQTECGLDFRQGKPHTIIRNWLAS
jgi:hypothetical protein